MKKFFTCLLVLACCLGLAMVSAQAEAPEEATPLKLGEEVKVNITETGETAGYFSYTPDEAGIYRFYGASEEEFNTSIRWSDSQDNYIDSDSDSIFEFVHGMSGGETYYFRIGSYEYWQTTGEIKICLEKIDTPPLVEGQTMTVAASGEEGTVYFSYVPEKDGLYEFFSIDTSNDQYFYGSCADSHWHPISDDNGSDFSLKCKLTKGEPYFFRVDYTGDSGSFGVCLEHYDVMALKMGESATADIAEGGKSAYFSFTPTANGIYRFYAPGTDIETIGCSYDLNFRQNGTNAGSGFSLTKDLKAGETCYFSAMFADTSKTGTFDVKIEKAKLPTLVLGQPETFTAAQQQVYTYFNFTAEESGYYAFYSSSNNFNGLYLALYDAEMNELNGAGGVYRSYINMTCKLEEGQSYVFGAYNYGTGDHEICLEKIHGEPLTLDQTTETALDRAGQGAYFSYTPQEDGFFIFSITDENDNGVGEYTYCWDSQTNYKFSRRNEASDPYYKLFCFMEGGEDYCFYVSYASNMLGKTLCATLENAEIPTLTLDEPATATIVESGKVAYFAYTPEEDGNYVFYAPGNEDTCGFFYDSKMNMQSEDDDGEGDGRFRLVCALKGGQKYYFGARYGLSYESSYMTGSFEVCLEQTEEHVHVWGDPAYELSLDRQTVTATRTCEDCDETETETAYVLNVFVSRPPTEDEYGELTYECDTFENPAFTQTTFTEDDISPLSEMDVLYMPEDLKVIEASAFENVTYCDAIIVPDGCETIAAGAFANCEYLYYVRLPKDCEVSPDAFEGCKGVHIYVE